MLAVASEPFDPTSAINSGMDSDCRAVLSHALKQCEQIVLAEGDVRPDLAALEELVRSQNERIGQTHAERLEAAQAVLAPELALIDLAIIATKELLTLSKSLTQERGRILWTKVPKTVPSAEVLFETLLINSANTLAAIRLLAAIGYDTQARSLVRRLHELADVTLAVLYDEATLRHYADKTEDFEKVYDIWRKHLSPGKLRRILRGFYAEIGVEDDVYWIAITLSSSSVNDGSRSLPTIIS